MSIEINFTDRESYLEWRANWRETYKAQAQEIRDGKAILKGIAKGSLPAAERDFKAAQAQRELHFSRRLAHRMMETLEEAKALSKAARELRQQQAAETGHHRTFTGHEIRSNPTNTTELSA